MIAPEIPLFDADSHAMAMDRRPLLEKIKDLGTKMAEKNNWLRPEKSRQSAPFAPTEAEVEL